MDDLSVVPNDLLEMVKVSDPDFPLCSAKCIIWRLEHSKCSGCEYYTRCKDFILGLQVGQSRTLRNMWFGTVV